MYYLISIISTIIGSCTNILGKNYVINTKEVKTSGDIYMFVSIIAATFYFFILAGGKVPLNIPTLIFSVVYAFIGTMSAYMGLIAYDYATLVYINVISGALGTILPFLYEFIFTDIVFTTNKIISVFFRIMAICVVLLFNREEKSDKKGILICVICGIISGAAGITTRMYANFPNVESDGSFCFWTNIFTLPMIFINIFTKNDVKTFIADLKRIKFYNYFLILGGMVISNAIILISIDIIRHISGTAHSVIGGSLGLLTTTFISSVIYKEKTDLQTIISVLLSIIAVILNLI